MNNVLEKLKSEVRKTTQNRKQYTIYKFQGTNFFISFNIGDSVDFEDKSKIYNVTLNYMNPFATITAYPGILGHESKQIFESINTHPEKGYLNRAFTIDVLVEYIEAVENNLLMLRNS